MIPRKTLQPSPEELRGDIAELAQAVLATRADRRSSRLECSACGAETEAACDCGVAYVPAGERAAKAVAEHPEKSDRAIAADIGVNRETVGRVRKQLAGIQPVEKRVGKDGKARRLPLSSLDKLHARIKADTAEYRAAKERGEREAADAKLAAFEDEAKQIATDLLEQIDPSLAQRLCAHLTHLGEGMALKWALGCGLRKMRQADDASALAEDVKHQGNGADHPQASADRAPLMNGEVSVVMGIEAAKVE